MATCQGVSEQDTQRLTARLHAHSRSTEQREAEEVDEELLIITRMHTLTFVVAGKREEPLRILPTTF